MFGWGRCGALLGILCVLCGAICAPVPGAAQAATHQPDKHGAVGVASPAVVLSPDAATATATATGTTDHAAGVHWHPIEDRKRVHELLLGGQYVLNQLLEVFLPTLPKQTSIWKAVERRVDLLREGADREEAEATSKQARGRWSMLSPTGKAPGPSPGEAVSADL